MRTPIRAVAAVLVLVAVAGVALAHGNHATANPQVSTDGTVVVERAFLSEPGYLVIRTDDGGEPGAVVGHRALERGSHTGLSVAVDPGFWANRSGNVTLWAVLHADDGDDRFRPADDRLLLWFGRPAGERFAVGKRDGGPVHVVATRGTTTNGRIVVDRVALAGTGYLVARVPSTATDAGEGATPGGTAVGHRELGPGLHRNVSLTLDPAFLRERNGSATVELVVARSDGDGSFDPATDRPVLVDGRPVASRLVVRGIGNGTGTGTETPAIEINTPSDTAAGSDTEGSQSRENGEPTDTPGIVTAADGSGLGVLAALAALGGLVAFLAGRVRWR